MGALLGREACNIDDMMAYGRSSRRACVLR
jgi:hypothetical protein